MGKGGRAGRLKTFRWVAGQDPTEHRVAKLVRTFCYVELRITKDKIDELRLKSAKLRHLREARDVMIDAIAGRYDAPELAKIQQLIERIENPPPPEPLHEDRTNITLGDQPVLILQMRATHVGRVALENLVFEVFSSLRSLRRPGSEWLAYEADGKFHHAGKSDWIALSRNVPLKVADNLQAALGRWNVEVERDTGMALNAGLRPFARLCDEDLEILVPAALAGDPREKRRIERGETVVVARGYEISDKAGELRRLFFDSGSD